MRIATFNIHRAVGADRRQDPARVAAVLRELNADVVALQEVGYDADTPGDLLAGLGEAVQAQVIEGATLQDERGRYGNALLSRLPVAGVVRHDLSVPAREPRGAIEVALTVDGVHVQIVATHLGLRPGERRDQIRALLPVFEGAAADVKILLGDLNEWFLWGRPLGWLRAVFGRLPAPASFPARWPWLALDRVWVRPAAVVASLRAHRSHASRIASDHLPVVAELNFDRLH